MNITINTDQPLSELDTQILGLLLGGVPTITLATVEPVVAEKPVKEKKSKKAEKAEEPPEPMAEPDDKPENDEPEDDEPEHKADEPDDGMSDEDLLALAVEKATGMVGAGEAQKVREALDAAGASRVRELSTDNVREFFKALSE